MVQRIAREELSEKVLLAKYLREAMVFPRCPMPTWMSHVHGMLTPVLDIWSRIFTGFLTSTVLCRFGDH